MNVTRFSFSLACAMPVVQVETREDNADLVVVVIVKMCPRICTPRAKYLSFDVVIRGSDRFFLFFFSVFSALFGFIDNYFQRTSRRSRDPRPSLAG